MDSGKAAIKKIFIILPSIASAAIIVYFLLCGVMNYFVIPKIVIPKVDEYLAVNFNGPVKLSIKDISFHPVKGFQLEDLKLSSEAVSGPRSILNAKLINLNFAFIPLLFKKVVVRRFDMFDVDLNIVRDATGAWNFQPLLDLDIFKTGQDFDFIIQEFAVKKGWLDYEDCFKEGNTLKRRFTDVELSLTSPRPRLCKITLSAGDKDRAKESVGLVLEYDVGKKSANGTIKLNTRYLGDYWHYYLDEILRPWYLTADSIASTAQFSYSKGVFSLSGQHKIDNTVLTYGDFHIRSDISVTQDLRYERTAPEKVFIRVKMSLDDVSSLSGAHTFLKKGDCSLIITERSVIIKEITGQIRQQPLQLSGKFTFGVPKELYLSGTIAGIKNRIYLKLISDNEGDVDWQAGMKDSYVRARAHSGDLKNLAFDLTAEGDLRLEDLSALGGSPGKKAGGRISFSGRMKGEADKLRSFHGGANIKAKDVSLMNLRPTSFDCVADIKDGTCVATIPKTEFYKGTLYGILQSNLKKWGIELFIDKLDMEELFKTDPELKGVKGIFTGNAACVGRWGEAGSARGGLYFALTDCVLKDVLLVKEVEEGVRNVTTTFSMPDFKEMGGNIEIRGGDLSTENMFCKSIALTLGVSGKFSFRGATDFTVGVKFQKAGLLKTARQILLPVTIGIDLLANCIQVRIYGNWPKEFKHSAQIQPVSGLVTFFSTLGAADPNKYRLKNLWLL